MPLRSVPRSRGLLAIGICLVGLLGFAPVTLARDSRPNAQEDPPSKEVLAEVAALRASSDVASAALKAEKLRAGKTGARAELLRLLSDPGTSQPVLEGILSCLEESNDQGERTIDVLIENFHRSEGSRKKRFAASLRRFDRSVGLTTKLLSFVFGEGSSHRAESLQLVVELIDTNEERRLVIKDLIEALKSERLNGDRALLVTTLEDLTFHRFGPASEWEAWYEQLEKEGVERFSERSLAKAALALVQRQTQSLWLRDMERAITALAKSRTLPTEFVDVATNPIETVRVIAVQQMVVACGDDEERGRKAVEVLQKSMDDDPSALVRRTVATTLGEIAKANPELRSEIVAKLVPHLQDIDRTMTRAVVQALRGCNDPSAADELANVYLTASFDPAAADLRRDVISALSGLQKNHHILLMALADGDRNVMLAAANSLRVVRKPEIAEDVAKALGNSQDVVIQQSLILALTSIGNFRPLNVVPIIRESMTDPRLQRDCWVALMAAIAAPEEFRPEPETAAEVEEWMREVYIPLPKADKAFLIQALSERPSPALVSVIAPWWLSESDQALRLQIAQAFRTIKPLPQKESLDLARRLIDTGYAASAEAVLTALLPQGEPTSPTPELDALRREVRALLWRALAAQTKPEALQQAESILSDEIKINPKDLSLRRARGSVRGRLQKNREAVDDLRLVHDNGLSDLGTEDKRRLTATLAELYLDLRQPAESKTVLDRIQNGENDRPLHILRARTYLALDLPDSAYYHAAEAALPETPPPSAEVLLLLVKSGLRCKSAEPRERALVLFEQMNRGGNGVDETVRAELAQHSALVAEILRIKNLVEVLGRESDEKSQEAESELRRAPVEDVAPWLLFDLKTIASQPSAVQILARRLSLLKALYPKAPALQALSLQAPTDIPNLIDALLAWWTPQKP